MMGKGVGGASLAVALERLSDHFPVLLIFCICALYAVVLGVHQPEFSFQRVSAQATDGAMCNGAFPIDAFARGGSLRLFAPAADGSAAYAAFDGKGVAAKAKVKVAETGYEAKKLFINGALVCEKCNSSEQYPLPAGTAGRLGVWVEIGGAETKEEAPGGEAPLFGSAFFEDSSVHHAFAPIEISIDGGWAAIPNAHAPSSFYSVDSPFHIHRASELSSYIPRLEWPHTFYTFLAVLPAGALHFALGITPEYAYKLELIALFFVPVFLFWLFSKKMPHRGRAVFFFASLLYLLVPSNGLPIGSGVDLFFVGLTAHTLATYLSLLFLFFSYEYLVEKKDGRLLPAAALFALALLSNQRVLFAMPFYFAAACLPLFAKGGLKRALPLGILCCLGASLAFLPFVVSGQAGGGGVSVSNPTEGYAVLGGAGFSGGGQDAALAFFQVGYVFLPFLFALGVLEAYRKKNLFALSAAAAAVLAYIFAASPSVNGVMPFVDGIRLFPSFYLIAYFISGLGCLAAYNFAYASLETLRMRLGYDRVTFAGAYAFSLLFPAGVVALSMGLAAMGLYGSGADTLQSASEISGIEKALDIASGETVLFVGRGEVSQHVAHTGRAYNFAATWGSDAEAALDALDASRGKYILLGNYNRGKADGAPVVMGIYRGLAASPELQEIHYGGSNPLFALRDSDGGRPVEALGAELGGYEILSDRARAKGVCKNESCSVAFHVDYGADMECSKPQGCSLMKEAGGFAIVAGIQKGEFEAEVKKRPPWFALPLLALCLLAAAAFAHPKALALFSK